MTTTTDRAPGRISRAAARCATIARKVLPVLGLIVAGFAGLITAEQVLGMITSRGIGPGEWRQVVLRALGIFLGLGVFWMAYGFPRDMWFLWRRDRERKRATEDESA